MTVETDDPEEEKEEMLSEELSLVRGTWTWWFIIFPEQ